MAGPEQAFRVKPNHRNTAPPLDGKQASAKLILYIRIFPDAHGKNHVEDKQEPEKDRSNFVVKLMAKKVDRRIYRKIYRCRIGGGRSRLWLSNSSRRLHISYNVLVKIVSGSRSTHRPRVSSRGTLPASRLYPIKTL